FAVPLTQGYKEARRGNYLSAAIINQLHAEARAAGVDLVSVSCTERPCRAVIATESPLDATATRGLARSFQDHIPGRPPIRLTTELSILQP
ncbi:MAG: hypothetical protein AAGF23_27540, partial [Acidobacteriota bacterium]